MRPPRAALSFCAVLFALGGCQSGGPQLYSSQSSALVSGKIKIGMTRSMVLSRLGTPHRVERHGQTEFYFYNPSWYILPAAVGAHIPIALQNDKVVGQGKEYYDGVVNGEKTKPN
jgi:hypothetical protein